MDRAELRGAVSRSSAAYPTTEVRWFFTGDIPASVERWFQNLGDQNDHLESRFDRYLRLPQEDALGIKLRENRLEIKIRTTVYGNVTFNIGVEGCLEGWRKWSFELADGYAEATAIGDSDPSWLSIGKGRVLKRFLVDDQRRTIPVPADDTQPRTCALELTRVTALDQRWWSLALEAYGHDVKSRDGLILVARQIFLPPCPFTLAVDNSLSFPQWLRETFSLNEA
jgi:hypothetical protein